MTNALQHSVNSGMGRGEAPLSVFIDIRSFNCVRLISEGPGEKNESRIGNAGDFYFIKSIVCKCSQDIFNDALQSGYTTGFVWPDNFMR